MKKTILTSFISSILAVMFVLSLGAWDNTKPGDQQLWNNAAGSIRDNNDAIEVQLGVDLALPHPYYEATEPQLKPDGVTAFDSTDNGRMWTDSDDNTVSVLTDFSVPTWTSTSASDNVTQADATFTLQNTDQEDSDGGRQSRFIHKGEQSGGEATTLGYTEASHDGTSDDQKGKWKLLLNDGDDADVPSIQPIGYLSTGKIDVSSSLSVLDEDDMTSDDDSVVATQQSIKAYVDGKAITSPTDYAADSGSDSRESTVFGNGMIFKSGEVGTVTADVSKVITFAVAFPSGVVSCSVTGKDVAKNTEGLTVTDFTTVDIDVISGNGHSGIYWQAWGF